MIGGYLLGSDAEAISFEPDTIGYRCAGAAHAVDPDDPVNAHAADLGYAICGTPVRIGLISCSSPAAGMRMTDASP